MFEAFSSLYNRFFGTANSTPIRNEASSANLPPRKGFFSGWSITFLFRPSAPQNLQKSRPNGTPSQPSFLQRIFPLFFSMQPSTDGSVEKQLEEHRVSTASSSSKQSEAADERDWVDRMTFQELPNTVTPKTISLYVDGSPEGKKIEIQQQGNKKIDSGETLDFINEDLASTNQAYEKQPASYLRSFNEEANRGFIYTLEASTLSPSCVTNRWIEHQPNTSNQHTNNPRVIEAHTVIDTIAKIIFANDDSDSLASREVLANHLKGISQQALFSSPLLAFMNHPPSDHTCLIQGNPSKADFSYSISNPREIKIKATAIYENCNDNTLIGIIENEKSQLEARPLGFPKDAENHSSGAITGGVSLTVVATIADDGKITTLRCYSFEPSWNVTSK